MGEKLGKYEVEKRQAVESEDYDKAKLKKVQMEEYRLQMYREIDVPGLLQEDPVSLLLDHRESCIYYRVNVILWLHICILSVILWLHIYILSVILWLHIYLYSCRSI